MRTVRRHLLVIATAAGLLALPAQAHALDWTIKGRGWGHGIGMSQYGALGLAQDGSTYKEILRHYYTGVEIDEAKSETVRVLIATAQPSIGFTSASEACGETLSPNKIYSFRLESGAVTLRRPNGSKLTGCGQEGVATGGESVVYSGVGIYRGDLRGRNVGGSLYAINEVGIEEYVQGVIPNESPSSWPQAALRAQAVAARSYALATGIGGDGYDLYDDTRSQTYRGASSEAASTNAATQATASEVITSGGETAVAFFFTSSGGHTENVELGFPGGSPRSYLKGVDDPFDDVSPYHKWSFGQSQAQMETALSGLFSGNLKRIDILERGTSPRIVEARVVGSTSSTVVSGTTLQYRLGLRSTWAKFRKN
jgi:stage II sporulation protein D